MALAKSIQQSRVSVWFFGAIVGFDQIQPNLCVLLHCISFVQCLCWASRVEIVCLHFVSTALPFSVAVMSWRKHRGHSRPAAAEEQSCLTVGNKQDVCGQIMESWSFFRLAYAFLPQGSVSPRPLYGIHAGYTSPFLATFRLVSFI